MELMETLPGSETGSPTLQFLHTIVCQIDQPKVHGMNHSYLSLHPATNLGMNTIQILSVKLWTWYDGVILR